MKIFLVKSQTNYGEVVHLVRATDETHVRNLVLNNDEVWDGYLIEEVDTSGIGILAKGGGE